MSLDDPETVDSVLMFLSGYDTLEYIWVKATVVSVRLRILFVTLQKYQHLHREPRGKEDLVAEEKGGDDGVGRRRPRMMEEAAPAGHAGRSYPEKAQRGRGRSPPHPPRDICIISLSLSLSPRPCTLTLSPRL